MIYQPHTWMRTVISSDHQLTLARDEAGFLSVETMAIHAAAYLGKADFWVYDPLIKFCFVERISYIRGQYCLSMRYNRNGKVWPGVLWIQHDERLIIVSANTY